ncbi:four helix bundle protein [Moheibacter sediminis]|uniref:Four helix bundle protein n=1 Tax=Moheibacter sediminis TaxID=1434700 RepID=A0A1W2BHC6_9FLAO|nr:four helix bundle protein [Moheibacter sediminis]SMC72281.1 four helix bundle protein [Moheibacter sediminis]
MQDYRKLQVWQRSHSLTIEIYQIKRAISSVPANIAEGCGRNSNKEFAQFLNISLGSLNESTYFLLLAKDLNYINVELFENLNNECNEIKAMIISLINKIRNEN